MRWVGSAEFVSGPFRVLPPETAQIQSEKRSTARAHQNTNFTPSWMSRGLFLCVVTSPKVPALLGSRPIPLPKYGWLRALIASARSCSLVVSLKLKFFEIDKLTFRNGWFRSPSKVVGTLRRPVLKLFSLTMPAPLTNGIVKAERSIPYL